MRKCSFACVTTSAFFGSGTAAALVALMLAALLLRLISLNNQLWIDEYLAREISQQPIYSLLTTYPSTNQHPFFAILAHFCLSFFGDQPWALRLPAVVFGVLTVPALYFCARQVTTRAEALLACALLVTSYQHVWFSQNGRGYTGMAFWAVLATGLFLNGLKLRRGAVSSTPAALRRNWILYALVMALGVYTHLAIAFVLLAHAVVFYFATRSLPPAVDAKSSRNAWISGFGLAALLSFLMHLPLLEDVYRLTISHKVTQMQRFMRGAQPPAPKVARDPESNRVWERPSWLIAETIRGLSRGSHPVAIALGGLLLGAGLLSFAWGARRDRVFLWLLIAPCIVTAIAMFVIWRAAFPRFYFFVVALMMILLARGIVVAGEVLTKLFASMLNSPGTIVVRSKRTVTTGLAAVVLLSSLLSLRSSYALPKQDIVGAMQYVEAHRAPGDQIVTIWPLYSVYQAVYNKPWRTIENAQELEALKPGRNVIWTMYSLPQSVQSYRPGIWRILQRDYEVVKVLPGTLGDGDVYVCRSKVVKTRP